MSAGVVRRGAASGVGRGRAQDPRPLGRLRLEGSGAIRQTYGAEHPAPRCSRNVYGLADSIAMNCAKRGWGGAGMLPDGRAARTLPLIRRDLVDRRRS